MPEDSSAGAPKSEREPERERDTHSGALVLSLSEAARRCGVSRRTLDRWMTAGKLLDFGDAQRGRRVRLDEAERLAQEARRLLGKGRGQSAVSADALEVRVGELEAKVRELTQDRDRWARQAEQWAAQAELLARALPAAPAPDAPATPARRSWWARLRGV